MTNPILKKRLLAVRRSLEKSGVDALLINDPISSLYLSGFPCSNSLIYIDRRKSLFATDSRYIIAAQQSVKHLEVIRMERDAAGEAPGLVSRFKPKSLGFEEQSPYAFYARLRENLPGINLEKAGGIVRDLRMIKSEAEIDQIAANQKLAERICRNAIDSYKAGLSETGVRKIILRDMVDRGVEEAFSTIVAVGPNSALPHAVPGPRKGKSGEFLLIDMGVKARHYHSDMTRTVAIGSLDRLDSQAREIYQVVLEAQKAALAVIRDGVECREVDEAARSLIARAGYGSAFGHGLGHGVGLEIHEGPTLSPRSSDVLCAGMVVSVEPGIYLPGKAGVRIEDLVVVTKTGCRNLNRMGKSLRTA